jgi:membrane-bound lytic murein transglycosylase F
MSKFAFLIITTILLQGCYEFTKPSNELKRILEEGKIVIASEYGANSYFLQNDMPSGFEYELAAGFAEFIGVELEIKPFYTNSLMLKQLQQQHIDIIASQFSFATDTLSQFKLGPAYQYYSQQVVIHRSERKLSDIKEMTGKVFVQRYSQQATIMQKHHQNTNINRLNWQQVEQYDDEELLLMVAEKKIDATIANSALVNVMRRRYPEIKMGLDLETSSTQQWLMHPHQDDSLLGALLEYFGELQRSGEFSRLQEKYFGHIREFDYVDTRAFIAAVETDLPEYQPWFEQYSGDFDWQLLAATSYQESHWEKYARSPTGVRGLMMLTLPTAKEVGITSRLDPEQSIRGGATYLKKLYNRIPARISDPDKTYFALAAYNLGLGHVEDARILTQRQGFDPDLWVDVKQHLPLLKQKKYYQNARYGFARGDVAVKYVENIRRYYDSLMYITHATTSAQSSNIETN